MRFEGEGSGGKAGKRETGELRTEAEDVGVKTQARKICRSQCLCILCKLV